MKFLTLFKRTVGILVLMMVAVLFAGCSSGKAASKKVVHISYWHVNAQTQGGLP
ncbi:hypothetical protein [Liquorilactobacillus mali]|uniref:hypothetical protein n=1 Tax=Liquorilactobacillus mali TaxID=1618 RepID=UPI000A98B4AB|nr:hypothetical protein [Liquorilactobacillus mali]